MGLLKIAATVFSVTTSQRISVSHLVCVTVQYFSRFTDASFSCSCSPLVDLISCVPSPLSPAQRSMEFHYSPEFLRSHCQAHSDGQVISGPAHSVIAQLYRIRAPFDRFILRYFYAVMGHLLTVFS